MKFTMNLSFKDFDQEGEENLKAIAEAKKFNKWMYDTIQPYCQGRVLEIGSGIGNISEWFIKDSKVDIVLSDIREQYRVYLRQLVPNDKVLDLDLVHPDFDQKYESLLGTFDAVFALNVVEHIEDDLLAVSNMRKLVKPKGNVVVLVPAYQSLYNRFDVELFHFRRYNASKLTGLFQESKLNVCHKQYFNVAGIFGWWLVGGILKKKTIPEGNMKLYNTLVPIFKLVDKVLFQKVGLSVIAVGERN